MNFIIEEFDRFDIDDFRKLGIYSEQESDNWIKLSYEIEGLYHFVLRIFDFEM